MATCIYTGAHIWIVEHEKLLTGCDIYQVGNCCIIRTAMHEDRFFEGEWKVTDGTHVASVKDAWFRLDLGVIVLRDLVLLGERR